MVPIVINRRMGDNKFHIDWSLNITNIIALVVLLGTLMNYGSQAIYYLKSNAAKIDIMWNHFDKSILSKEELLRLEEVK